MDETVQWLRKFTAGDGAAVKAGPARTLRRLGDLGKNWRFCL